MSEKLLPCPFCGGEAMPAEVEQIEHSGWVGRIACGTCDAVFSLQYSANFPGKAGNEVIAAWNRRELESASQPGGGEADIIERFKNPMTPYGLLIRALRIVAGTTMMEMATHLQITPSYLSGMEHGRKPVTVEDAIAASKFFALKGIDGTLWAMTVALRAATGAGNGGAEGGSSLAGLRQGNATTPANVDELVPPTAVRANEVDPEVINSGLDGVKSNLDAAADADPHSGLRAEGSGLHDRQSAENNPATHDAENTALISADSAVNSQRGSQITATWSHDAGAYARCSYCGRYSDNPHSLTKDSFPCDCGKLHGWSGSFKKPGPDAKWSDAYLMPPNGKREAAR